MNESDKGNWMMNRVLMIAKQFRKPLASGTLSDRRMLCESCRPHRARCTGLQHVVPNLAVEHAAHRRDVR